MNPARRVRCIMMPIARRYSPVSQRDARSWGLVDPERTGQHQTLVSPFAYSDIYNALPRTNLSEPLHFCGRLIGGKLAARGDRQSGESLCPT
jgi:hypothetical protein